MIYDLQLKNRNRIFFKDQRGIAALIVVVLIGATALIMAFSASWFGIVDLDTGYIAKKGEEVGALADGCMDNALQRLRFDINYTGETLSAGGGSCIISAVANGNDRIVTVGASIGNYYQGLTASVTLNGNVVALNSWQESN